MTSTFPTSRSNSHNLRYSIKQLQHKKEALINLEAALKKRINEFRELCLKEGELTGHLPADYPLQPREPIPQVRRRITRSNGNIPNEFQASLSGSSNSAIMPPPTSTVRLVQRSGQVTPNFVLHSPLSNVELSSISSYSPMAESYNHQTGHPIRGIHNRSSSESVTNGYQLIPSQNIGLQHRSSDRSANNSGGNHVRNSDIQKPIRPTRTLQSTKLVETSKTLSHQSIEKQGSESNINGLFRNGIAPDKRQLVKTSVEALTNSEHLGTGLDNFQPYYEETKPFQMSDFYKYSAKHRQKASQPERSDSIDNVYVGNQSKSTRQLQDEIARMKNPLKFAACDDQIQASQKLIEKNDQILMRATAKAIAVNPSIAEKLSSIAFHNNNEGRY